MANRAEISRIPLHAVELRGGFHEEIRTEFIRKSIHLSIAFVPALTDLFGVTVVIALLSAGILTYSVSEFLRLHGHRVPIISLLTELSARRRDKGRFVLGPVTLGLGAMLALMLYPEPAAAIAVYALAFGDGLSSIVGKSFGTVRIPFTGGKSIEGSLTCFLSVFLSAYAVTRSLPIAYAVAMASTVLEAIPSRDLDNIILPAGAGLVAMLLT